MFHTLLVANNKLTWWAYKNYKDNELAIYISPPLEDETAVPTQSHSSDEGGFLEVTPRKKKNRKKRRICPRLLQSLPLPLKRGGGGPERVGADFAEGAGYGEPVRGGLSMLALAALAGGAGASRDFNGRFFLVTTVKPSLSFEEEEVDVSESH
ncbi:hypothetical protein ACJJTC_013027 [Scirpophaga incertulas]